MRLIEWIVDREAEGCYVDMETDEDGNAVITVDGDPVVKLILDQPNGEVPHNAT